MRSALACLKSDVTVLADPASFIRTNTRPLPVPLAPELLLHLADDVTAIWQKTEDELDEVGLPPPFWAFAWPGGQALARYILDHPAVVRNRSVLDIGSGSGLLAIAAARSGARLVIANDIDAVAGHAIALNAEANGVSLRFEGANVVGRDGGWDVVLAGDIAYQEDMAGPMFDWLQTLATRGADVLVGDPGRSYLPRETLESIAGYEVPVSRDVEDADVKRSCVWRFKGR